MNYLPNKKGFTLVELLIVAAILGVMATFVIIQFRGVQASARDAKRKSDIKQYAILLEVYANRNNGTYPILMGQNNPVTSLCTSVGLSPCVYDPNPSIPPSDGSNYNYTTNASGTEYVLVAHLERAKDSTGTGPGHFFLCSSGKVTEDVVPSSDPENGVCP